MQVNGMQKQTDGCNTLAEAGGGRRSDALTVSVVIASCRERHLLDACLQSLLPQCHKHRAETVVARACNAGELTSLTGLYPSVRFVAAPLDSTIPHLRAAGMAAATGDVVALTEDHCVVAPDWITQLVCALRHGADVVGGAMDNAQRERMLDWAAYFAEYGFFAENGGSQPTGPLLTAANVAYRRCVVNEVVMWAGQGEWESVIHGRLLAQGRTLKFLKAAAVYQNKNYRFWDFCRDRFVHGRDYARRRLIDTGMAWRWFYLCGVIVLPVVLTIRVAQAAGCRLRWPFLYALPITFAFLLSWVVGEAVGYWCGPVRPEAENV